MPRKRQSASLHRRRDRGGLYIIRDGGRYISTGTRDRREAEAALARYLADRDRPSGPATPDTMTISAALDIYGCERAPTVSDPARIGFAIAALVPILGDLPCSAINSATCRRYGEARRRAPGTVRKELGVLQAALNYCHAEGYLSAAPRVRLPSRPPARNRWLTRDEVAKLLRAARKNPKAKHLTRFILTAIYTGTRSQAILALQFMPNTCGGHVDTATGIMHRRPVGTAETTKRTPAIPLPRRLLAHMRRWEANGARHVVEIDGQRVGSVKHSWATALREAGIEHCTRHDLRHTCATWLMQSGVDKWSACGFLGLTMEMIESTYGHHHPDHMASVIEAMDRRA